MARGEVREAPVPVPGELVPDNSLVRSFRSAGVCNGRSEQYSSHYIFYVSVHYLFGKSTFSCLKTHCATCFTILMICFYCLNCCTFC